MATEAQLRNAGLREVWIAGLESDVDIYLQRQIIAINRFLREGAISDYTRQELNEVLAVLKQQMDLNVKRMRIESADTAYELALADVETEAGLIFDHTGVPATLPTDKRVKASVRNTKFIDAVTGRSMNMRQISEAMSTTNWRAVEGIVRQGYAEGMSNRDIQKILVGTRVKPKDGKPYYSGGYVPGVHKRDVMASVRTMTSSMSRNAREMVWEENDDLVEEVEIVATLDNRTTPLCMRLDGTRWKVNDPNRPRSPFHFNCRSTEMPVLPDVVRDPNDPNQNRVAKTGTDNPDAKVTSEKVWQKKQRTDRAEVPAGTSYDDFLRGNYKGGQQQPEWFLEDLMGKERAKIYRENKSMTVKDLTKSDGKSYTVKELKQKYQRASKV